MKNSKKEVLKIAKQFFGASFTGQKLDTKKIKTNVNLIKKEYKTRSVEILKVYFSLLKHALAQETLVIESTDKLSESLINQIKNYFEKKSARTLNVEALQNQNILGGLKVTLGDNSFDFSVREKISEMKEALSGRHNG